MSSKIYAIANIGRLKLFVSDVSNIKVVWPPQLEILNSGNHPNAALQEEWNREGDKRRFTFHTHKEIAGNREIIGIEQLEQ
ncbi:hypothetical protein [Calothrix sp. PCC 7507]|uniref:hypothetical protein n=1 Tax=Calothrix sp. PCC 7507 TaxID=99598 RepID=UPI00029F353B|nr:hypothetical protein [Calothrix sp. PCC 7507]AFY34837.1 hypothetical protein Cal7507_4467 [Calothrix sp. PCC 7507]